jgi:type IV secretion system protein VirB1
MWAELALECAPNVALPTMEAIIRVESAGNPLAINVNGLRARLLIPVDKPAVVQLAKDWIAKGYSVDLGLGQVNSRNLPRLGLTVEQVLDPCTNLRASATILTANYNQAIKTHGPGQRALQAALSAYNTGSFSRGFTNGYVGRYYDSVPAVASKPIHIDAKTTSTHNPYAEKAGTWPTAWTEEWK